MTLIDEDMGQGEIRRGFARLEKQLDTVQLTLNTVMGPVGELRVIVNNVVKDVDELGEKVRMTDTKVSLIEIRNAAITGGVMSIFFLIKFLLSK
jgi:hypothetical protein